MIDCPVSGCIWLSRFTRMMCCSDKDCKHLAYVPGQATPAEAKESCTPHWPVLQNTHYHGNQFTLVMFLFYFIKIAICILQ